MCRQSERKSRGEFDGRFERIAVGDDQWRSPVKVKGTEERGERDPENDKKEERRERVGKVEGGRYNRSLCGGVV